ncbi:Galactokinase [Acidisarcina polymorpha]|uniref:Galactokinase n=1 Tax=Acidisarcina polymorpha TaxID=2211140 RepID=A0A2Z5FY27_9BACT|nr:galactokinase [Acidisarcina polymorpha]AXC11789.1 Galactokinase [Acidisarcina polymorpha]
MLDVSATKEVHVKRFGAEPAMFMAPGRVNLIGEHTDYSEGFVMPAAIDFATLAGVSPRADRQISISSENFGDQAVFDLDFLPHHPRHHWSDYPIGVLTVLKEVGVKVSGFNLTLSGDVPLGSGLSSSASVEVATALAILEVAAKSGSTHHFSGPEIARLCQRAENHFVGTQSGIMDQFVSCCGAAGKALLLDCRDLSFELAPISPELSIVICNTMVKHSHAGGEYNTRRAEIEAGAEIIRLHRSDVRFLRDVTVADLERWGDEMLPDVLKRCRHVVTENLRTVAAARALEQNDLPTLGRLMAESHASYRDDFEASCKEADILVELASREPACVGARLTGGGFGGCTVNLVHTAEADQFGKKMLEEYLQATGIAAEIYHCHAAAGAHRI